MTDNRIQDNKLHMLGKLTAGLLHEIRNPLSAVKLNLDYLKMLEDEMNDDIKESVYSCHAATERIEFLVNSLLDFSRKSQNGFEMGDLNFLTDNVIEILNGDIQKKNISLKKSLDQNLPHFYFNRNKILQVFINLITNAAEAIINRGEIKVATFRETINDLEYFVWQIEDNGQGIKDEDQDKIFNDFYTSKESGTGLGLSVCKDILEEHNAEIFLSSDYGHGTKFKIVFNPKLLREKYEN